MEKAQGNLSVIRQKGEYQHGRFKKTKYAKFSEKFPGYVCVSAGKKMFVFKKIWRALFSCYLRFEIRLFVLLSTN